MTRKHVPSVEDTQLFRRHVGRVHPVAQKHVPVRKARPAAVPVQTIADERAVMHDMLSGEFDPAELETGEELIYRAAGLQLRQFRKLRRGQFVVEAELDLHGLDAVRARLAISDFINRSRIAGRRCVRIIHGKGRRSRHGRPVLKTRVAHWLRQRKDVLGYSSARSVDGGTGAVYVLIRRAD